MSVVSKRIKDFVSGVVELVEAKVGRLAENIDKGQIRVDRLAREFRERGYFVVVPSRINRGGRYVSL